MYNYNLVHNLLLMVYVKRYENNHVYFLNLKHEV